MFHKKTEACFVFKSRFAPIARHARLPSRARRKGLETTHDIPQCYGVAFQPFSLKSPFKVCDWIMRTSKISNPSDMKSLEFWPFKYKLLSFNSSFFNLQDGEENRQEEGALCHQWSCDSWVHHQHTQENPWDVSVFHFILKQLVSTRQYLYYIFLIINALK